MRWTCTLVPIRGISSRVLPIDAHINCEFSSSIIPKHWEELSRWEKRLLGSWKNRRRSYSKRQWEINRYLSKLNNAFQSQGRVVVPIGGKANGLARESSDLDLVLVTHQSDAKRAEFDVKLKKVEHFRRSEMNRVASTLRDFKLVDPSSVQQLLFSNVPIVKFRSPDGVNVDVQFNNVGSIRSTLFVKTCVETSMIVPFTVHWINSYFDELRLKDSRHGLFSSYHLNMLALHYLQAVPFSVIPTMIECCPHLHPQYPWERVVEILRDEDVLEQLVPVVYAQQDASIAETIIRMIDYYSQLDLQQTAIDISGRTYKRSEDTDDDGFIQIIDPYFGEDLTVPRCNVLNGPSLIQQAFSVLKSELEMGNLRRLLRFRLPL
ncbi:hypothetical protein Q1695_001939 [Nippostrongylus brasiliensis]|nr:hypothetical protein Q1695_001939 [Nippostrongylus brasiliensis]